MQNFKVAPNKAPAIVDTRTRVMLGFPEMLWQNSHLKRKLFHYSTSLPNYRVDLYSVSENRFHDYARNLVAMEFLRSECEWLVMIDSDVDPHFNLMNLTKRGHEIVSACVYCHVKDTVYPSVWQRAECHECMAAKLWREKKEIKDTLGYRAQDMEGGEKALLRWNPFRQNWQVFIGANGEEVQKCRCMGTARDPLIYQVHKKVFSEIYPFEADSVGAAAICIHRSVFEKVPFPWFQFLYYENRQVLCGEDHFFCWKAKMEGFEIWADTQMPCSHFKDMDLLHVNNMLVKSFKLGLNQGIQGTQQAMKQQASREATVTKLSKDDKPLIVIP